MQIVSTGDNLHEMSNPVFWKKNNINLSSAEQAKGVVKVKLKVICMNFRIYRQSLYLILLRKHFVKGHGLVQCYFPWTAQRFITKH